MFGNNDEILEFLEAVKEVRHMSLGNGREPDTMNI